MTKSVLLATLIASLIICTACANLNIQRNETPVGGERSEIEVAWILWGLVPVKKLSPAPLLCPKGKIESINQDHTGKDILLTWITLGFYVPQRATVVCSK